MKIWILQGKISSPFLWMGFQDTWENLWPHQFFQAETDCFLEKLGSFREKVWRHWQFGILCRSYSSVSADSVWPHGIVHWILQARILAWVLNSFSRGSSPHRDQTQDSRITGWFFTNWATREGPGASSWIKMTCFEISGEQALLKVHNMEERIRKWINRRKKKN